MGSSLKIIFDHFFTISVIWLLLLRVFLFLRIFHIFFISFRFLFFYFTRSMKIITGRRHWVLTEESPRLTTMDDNNTLAVFAGYYTRNFLPLASISSRCSRYPPRSHQVKRNQDTCPRILSDMHRSRFAVRQYFVSSQELSCRHKHISNSKLTDPSALSGSPLSREMTDTQPGLH